MAGSRNTNRITAQDARRDESAIRVPSLPRRAAGVQGNASPMGLE